MVGMESLLSIELPVGETLHIKKTRLKPVNIHTGLKRISIITGIHGDELEGQYIVYELIRRIREQPEMLRGIVDIYPCINPLGMELTTRRVPTFDIDMNCCFPGNEEGDMVEQIAAGIVEDILGTDICVDIHASNIFIREIPQVRLRAEDKEKTLEYAKLLNTEFVWICESQTVLESSLCHTLNRLGVPTLATEMGVGMRITRQYGEQLVDGLFALMKKIGIWSGETKKIKSPVVSSDGEVKMVHAGKSGIFIPDISHWEGIEQGDVVGDIIDPAEGRVLEHILAPCSGTVFSLREYPVVYEGSLIARILSQNAVNT